MNYFMTERVIDCFKSIGKIRIFTALVKSDTVKIKHRVDTSIVYALIFLPAACTTPYCQYLRTYFVYTQGKILN